MCEKINITENITLVNTYRDIEKKIAYEEIIEKPTFSNECCVLNTEGIIKIMQLLGYHKTMLRFGISFYRDNNYWKINFENSKRLPEDLRKNRRSLHRIIYILYYGNKNNIHIDDYHIHHLCRNPNCINPKHLMAIKKDKHKEVEYLNQKLIKEGKTIDEIRYIIRQKLNRGEL